MLVDAECDRERTIFEKPEQGIMRPGETREQMHRLEKRRSYNVVHTLTLANAVIRGMCDKCELNLSGAHETIVHEEYGGQQCFLVAR